MNAITAPKSAFLNRLEGMALLAILKGLPACAAAAMVLKLLGSGVVNHPGGAVTFVVATSLFQALLMAYLVPRSPKQFRNGNEPLFFDASLSFAEKVQRLHAQPMASLQLYAMMVMLSLLSVAVLSVG